MKLDTLFVFFKKGRRCFYRLSWIFRGFLLKMENLSFGFDFGFDFDIDFFLNFLVFLIRF